MTFSAVRCASTATTTGAGICQDSGSRCARSITGQLMIPAVQTGKRIQKTTGRSVNTSAGESKKPRR